MNDFEFDLLDELYFVISYDNLKKCIDFSETEIKDTLISLSSKGWIRIYSKANEELEEFDLMTNFRSYYYLASKKGLLAHNRQ